jgi:hypothetical protein
MLGGEDEKNKALDASSQSQKNQMKPLVQAAWGLVLKGRKGDLRLFADSDAFESSDDESDNESEEDGLTDTEERLEGGEAGGSTTVNRQKRHAKVRTGDASRPSDDSALEAPVEQMVRLSFLLETKLGATAKMRAMAPFNLITKLCVHSNVLDADISVRACDAAKRKTREFLYTETFAKRLFKVSVASGE